MFTKPRTGLPKGLAFAFRFLKKDKDNKLVLDKKKVKKYLDKTTNPENPEE